MTDPEQPATFTDRPLPPVSSDPDAPPPPPAPPAGPPHPNVGWAVLWCVALVLVSQIAGGVVGAVIILGGIFLSKEPPPNNVEEALRASSFQAGIVAGQMVAHVVILLLALLLLRVVAGRDWPRQVAWRPPAWHQWLVALLMSPGLLILATGFYLFLHDVLKVPSMKDFGLPGMSEMEKMITGWPLWLGVLVIGVTPAFSEELWCRAFLGRGLVGTHGYVLGVFFTSLLFGLIHLDPGQAVMAAGMGLFLHAAYLWTRSLWVPMFLHFLNNSTSVLLARLPETEVIEKRLLGDCWPILACAGVVTGLGMLAFWLGRTRLVTPPGERPWEPPYPGVECPPEGAATRPEAETPHPAAWGGLVLSLGVLVWLLWRALP